MKIGEKEMRVVKGPFWTFFALLMAAEITTILLTLLLLGGATRLWFREQARGLAAVVPKIAAQFNAAELEKIEPDDTQAKNATYKSVVERLAASQKAYLPESGQHLSIVVVGDGKEAKIAASEDSEEQESVNMWFPVESYALEAIENKVSYSPSPYDMGGVENVTAYAVIGQASGGWHYLVTVDMDTSPLVDVLRMVRYSFLLSVIPATLVSVVLATFLSTRFVNVLDFLRMIHELAPRRRRSALAIAPRPAPLGSSPPDLEDVPPPNLPPAPSPLVEDAPQGPPPVDETLPTSPWNDDPVDARWASLTERERETATLSYLKYKEIAERMGISIEGVKKHSQNARAKLGVRDRVEMALYAVRMGALGQELPANGSPDHERV